MKKWLMLFAVVDLIFVGLVLKYSNQSDRQIASTVAELELSSGQKNKIELTTSFRLNTSDSVISFETDKLQSICDTSTFVELKFQALRVAFAGAQPSITHSYSCAEIKKNLSNRTLETKVSDFKSMQAEKSRPLLGSSLVAEQVYSDEDFPEDWQLVEVKVTGPSNFTINQFELEQIHGSAFEFKIISVK